ncbi:MAG: PASTA domain-containing protein [Elusimicrobia bacterium]|nr:PASTA domain-containing protein [Elusimicrobiota bacterium]
MKKILEWILLLLILGIVGFVGLNRLINALIHSKQDRIVPNLIGKNIADALDELSSLNLFLKKTGEDFNVNMPAGMIISQTPSAGSVIKENRAINIIVSSGGEVIFVPNLTNQTVRTAQVLLRKNGLDFGEQDEKYSEVIEKDRIISQSPLPRSPIQKNGLVNIVVSLGIPPEGVLVIPDFVGKNITEAENWAKQNNITIKSINKISDSSVAENTIIKQTPEEGIAINKNQSVEFWIAIKLE